MRIDEEQVRYVAELANLNLTAEETARTAREMSDILTHIDKLNEVDTSEVEPMAQVLFDQDETATLRADVPRPTLGAKRAVENAPLAGAGHFKVPRVIDR